MIVVGLAIASFVFAFWPAVLYALNVRLYRRPPIPDKPLPAISILIPARNEEGAIAAAIEAALTTRRVDFEVIVLDDQSTDKTADIVRGYAARDGRVRVESAPELPPGWCGKQHACFALAKLSRHPVLCFIDADVRLAPDGVSRMAGFLESSGADLVSGFPQQVMGSFLERLLIPLIHFLLLGYLPLGPMRRNRRTSFAAGCGQLMLVRRESYDKAGGHTQVRASLHDGVSLPRAFRRQGLRTDLCDASDSAFCRMYQSGRAVVSGLAKNAHEGLAAPRLIGLATLILLVGQVLPLAMLLTCLARLAGLFTTRNDDFYTVVDAYQHSGLGLALALSSLATLAMYYPRFEAAVRFRQPMEGALLHPIGVLVLLAIQWYALIRRILGRPSVWKGRSYAKSMDDAGRP